VRGRHFLIAVLGAGCVIAAHAESAAGLVAKGDKHWAESRFEPAQQSFEAAVAAEPRSAETLLRLAGFQLSRQQLEAGIASYKRVIGLDGKNARAWMGLGIAYLHTGRRELAKAAFDEAVRIDPRKQEKLGPLIAKLDTPTQ